MLVGVTRTVVEAVSRVDPWLKLSQSNSQAPDGLLV